MNCAVAGATPHRPVRAVRSQPLDSVFDGSGIEVEAWLAAADDAMERDALAAKAEKGTSTVALGCLSAPSERRSWPSLDVMRDGHCVWLLICC
jgi:hypothetical protein